MGAIARSNRGGHPSCHYHPDYRDTDSLPSYPRYLQGDTIHLDLICPMALPQEERVSTRSYQRLLFAGSDPEPYRLAEISVYY